MPAGRPVGSGAWPASSPAQAGCQAGWLGGLAGSLPGPGRSPGRSAQPTARPALLALPSEARLPCWAAAQPSPPAFPGRSLSRARVAAQPLASGALARALFPRAWLPRSPLARLLAGSLGGRPAVWPAQAGCQAGSASQAPFSSKRLYFSVGLYKSFSAPVFYITFEQVFPLSLLLSSRHLKSCSISQSLL